jgi:hypothetical protein
MAPFDFDRKAGLKQIFNGRGRERLRKRRREIFHHLGKYYVVMIAPAVRVEILLGRARIGIWINQTTMLNTTGEEIFESSYTAMRDLHRDRC